MSIEINNFAIRIYPASYACDIRASINIVEITKIQSKASLTSLGGGVLNVIVKSRI